MQSLLFYNRFRSVPEISMNGRCMSGWNKPLSQDEIDLTQHVFEYSVNNRLELQVWYFEEGDVVL